MNRRTLLVAGAGAAAGAAGLGWAWWQQKNAPRDDEALAQLWALRLPQPYGTELSFATLRGKPLVLNFWATWCPPCIREMPALDRFHRDFSGRGWQVVGIAVDNAGPVVEFLQKVKIGFPIALAGLEGIEIGKRLGNTGGGLPFTVAIDAAGRITQRKLGETQYEDLAGWAAKG
jgi:thiol-disulfide isomerase/thioredoxin